MRYQAVKSKKCYNFLVFISFHLIFSAYVKVIIAHIWADFHASVITHHRDSALYIFKNTPLAIAPVRSCLDKPVPFSRVKFFKVCPFNTNKKIESTSLTKLLKSAPLCLAIHENRKLTSTYHKIGNLLARRLWVGWHWY